MRLTNHFIRKKVKALAGQSGKRQSNFCTLKDARHILVLFNAEDRDVVEPCLKTLRTLNKNVNVCVYVSGETVPEMNPSYMVVHAKTDLDMWYMPTDEIQKKFYSCNADILIDLTQGNNYVGAKNGELDLYDLTISMTENADIKHLFEHILFYLQTIRSK